MLSQERKKIPIISRESWLSERRKFIGASEVSVLLGLNKWQTKLDLYLNKVEGLETPENDRMYWGRQFEDAISKGWAEKSGRKIRKTNFLYVYNDTVAATLDRISGDEVIEIKNMSDYAFNNSEKINGIPNYYYAQVQAQLLASGYNKARFVALINNGELYEQELESDESFQQQIWEESRKFIKEHIIPKNPPKIENLKKESSIELSEDVIEGSESHYMLFERISLLNKAIKQLQDEKDELLDAVKEELQNKSAIVYNGNKLFWYSKYQNFNSGEFKKDNPELYEKYKTLEVIKLNIARS